jgi:hypothetical protein
MNKILLISALWLSSAEVAAQNVVSQKLLSLTDAQRNAAFRQLITDTKDRCDRVVRTQFNGTAGQIDDWEARCNDGNTYSFSIPSDLTTVVKYLSCAELLMYGKALAQSAGDKRPVTGCKMK